MKAHRGKIRVLYTIPNFDTAGSGLLLYELATHLDKEQFEPHIACLHEQGRFMETVRASGIPIHVFPFTCDVGDRLSLPFNTYKIAHQFRRIAPDVIHSFHYSSDYSEPLAARLAGIKWVYTKKNMGWQGASHNSWVLRSRLASGIIAQNKQMLKDFFPDWRKVKYIPSWVDTEKFAPWAANAALREQWGVQPEERIVICVANLVPVKGVELLIQAFHSLTANHPLWKIWIVGDHSSDYGKSLLHLTKELQLNHKINFIGKVLTVKDYLNQAEVFVLPSYKEASPVALLEAMAMEKYIIASDIDGTRDQLAYEPNYLFESGNITALADRLKDAFTLSFDQIKKIGHQMRRRVIENYNINKQVAAHEQLYETLVFGKYR